MPTVYDMTGSDNYSAESRLSIGEVARMAGVTVATVRNWEKAGKIASIRTPGGQRRFEISDVRAMLSAGAVAS